jgi:hypothetical protein
MDVEAAEGRQVQHRRAQNLPEGRDDDHVRLPGAQLLHRFGLT